MPDPFIYAFIAGLGIAVMSGVLGCFVVWQRMAYFGDALAHSATLGIALGLVLHINFTLAIMVTSLSFALILVGLQKSRAFSVDSLLGVLSHSFLALGLVALHFLDVPDVDLHDFLLGDILAVSLTDIYGIYAVVLVVVGLLWRYWSNITLMITHMGLARAEGVPIFAMNAMVMVLVALVVSVGARTVGILLIASLLIIPAVAVSPLSKTPQAMARFAVIFAMIAVSGGLGGTAWFGLPSGPSIIFVATILFALGVIVGQFKARARVQNL